MPLKKRYLPLKPDPKRVLNTKQIGRLVIRQPLVNDITFKKFKNMEVRFVKYDGFLCTSCGFGACCLVRSSLEGSEPTNPFRGNKTSFHDQKRMFLYVRMFLA